MKISRYTNWKPTIEKKTKIFRYDRGGEFTLTKLNFFCE